MDENIQNKWDQFRSKEEEYLKLNDQIEQRRKDIADRIKQTKKNEVDEDQEGSVDEFGINEKELERGEHDEDDEAEGNGDQEEEEEEEQKHEEFSNRKYIDQIVQRVNKQVADKNDDNERDGGDDDDDDNIDASQLLKKQEQLEAQLSKHKSRDQQKQHDLLELEMLVEEQEKTIKIQRMRKEALASEVDSLQDTLAVKESVLAQLGEKGRSFEEENESYQTQLRLLAQKIEDTKAQTAQLQALRLAEEKETKIIQTEIEMVKKDIKKRGTELSKKELKLNRLQEELDKAKLNLQTAGRTQGADKAVDAKKLNEQLNLDIKKYDRQIQELLQAFKKQLRLIDILKRQKNHLIAGQIFAYTEESFLAAIKLGQKI